MSALPEELVAVAKRVTAGERPTATIRNLLAWFKQKRRGYWVVETIRASLKALNVETSPDFEDFWIDAEITFVKRVATPPAPAATTGDAVAVPTRQNTEPALKVGHLEAANRKPIRIARDKSLAEAMTLMLAHDFSQLPVMNGDRTVLGLVSWRSIGRSYAFGKNPTEVRDAMDPQIKVFKRSDSFHSIVQEIVANDAVLVKDEAEQVCGIVTAADISAHFRNLSEPFLLLGEIERSLRHLIGDKFDAAALAAVRNPSDTSRVIDSADDLSFGEYIRLLESPASWARLGLSLDRNVVVDRLKEIKDLRNDIMHFDPDVTEPQELEALRQVAEFLRHVLNR